MEIKEKVQKVLYTGKTHTISGREGSAKSSDGRLNVKLSVPGSKGEGTNPEQMFAAGWSACFLGALGNAAKKEGLTLPVNSSIDAEVDLATSENGYLLQARLNVHMPDMDKEIAKNLIDIAHQTCPYSKATHGNINVVTTLI